MTALLNAALELARQQAQSPFYRLEEEPTCSADFTLHIKADWVRLIEEVRIMEQGVFATTFAMTPIIETPEAYAELVSLTTTLNDMEEEVLGFFRVNFANLEYRLYCPAPLIKADPKLAQKYMFEEGVRRWALLAVPILNAASGRWSEKKAGGYVREVYWNGTPKYDGVPTAH